MPLLTRSTSIYTLVANARSVALSASGHGPTNKVGLVAKPAIIATKSMNKENTMEQTTKEPERYPIMFSADELKELEDLIYEKSSILDSMSEFKAYKKDHAQAKKLSMKAIRLEKIAVRLGIVLDRLLLENGSI